MSFSVQTAVGLAVAVTSNLCFEEKEVALLSELGATTDFTFVYNCLARGGA